MASIETFLHGERRAGGAHDGEALARGLAWFGIGLGITELAFPRRVARGIGVRSDRRAARALRAFGVREVLAGLGILLRPRRSGPAWARVFGDVLDAGLLAIAAFTRRRSNPRLATAAALVAGAGVLDVIASRRIGRARQREQSPVIAAVTIARPRDEVYAYFRQFKHRFPVSNVPAEVIDDEPGERIMWRTIDNQPVDVRSAVLFADAPVPGHTEVRVAVELGFDGMSPSRTLAKMFAQPKVRGDLRRLKQVLEAGEVLKAQAGGEL